MLNVNPQQWREWQNHPVTKMLAGVIKEKISDGLNAIVSSNDPEFDKLAKGKIYGYQDILEWEPEFEGEYIEDDNIQRVVTSGTSDS